MGRRSSVVLALRGGQNHSVGIISFGTTSVTLGFRSGERRPLDRPTRTAVREFLIHATDELVMVLEMTCKFEIAGQVCHPAIGEELLDPRWCHAFGTQHPGNHSPLDVWVQAIKCKDPDIRRR